MANIEGGLGVRTIDDGVDEKLQTKLVGNNSNTAVSAPSENQVLVDDQGNLHVRALGYDDNGDDQTIRVDTNGNQYVIAIDEQDGTDTYDRLNFQHSGSAILKDAPSEHLYTVTSGYFLELKQILVSASTHSHTHIEYGSAVATAEVTDVTPVADVSESLHETYFILQDQDGSVAFWFDLIGAAVAGVEPAHGADRSVAITTVSVNDLASTIAGLLITAIDADPQFSAASGGGDVVRVTDANTGARPSASAGTSGFTVAEFTAGSDAYKTLAWLFTNPSHQNAEITLAEPLKVGAGNFVRITKYNKDNQTQDLHSTVIGVEKVDV